VKTDIEAKSPKKVGILALRPERVEVESPMRKKKSLI